ncbi:MAG: succinate dehydrogenase cytochrome b subunit [Acidimicrobiia bacterium]
MAKVEEELSTADQTAGADDADELARTFGAPVPPPKQGHFLLRFWQSAVGKKWLMALSGIVLLGFVLVHMIGNLKVFLGKEHINTYGEWLRTLGEPALPRTVLLWIVRVVLIGAFVVHIVAAAQLTRMNQKARPVRYQSKRDYVAANFASRTMRLTGIVVALFVIFHLLDLTAGTANGGHFVRGDAYDNLFNSFERVPVAIAYIVAMCALSVHIFHGAWSMFQSLGLNNPRYNAARRYFAVGFALLILAGNVSMPLLITTGAVSR